MFCCAILVHKVYSCKFKFFKNQYFIALGPKFWKDLPAFIKMNPSLNIFKARLKRHLL